MEPDQATYMGLSEKLRPINGYELLHQSHFNKYCINIVNFKSCFCSQQFGDNKYQKSLVIYQKDLAILSLLFLLSLKISSISKG